MYLYPLSDMDFHYILTGIHERKTHSKNVLCRQNVKNFSVRESLVMEERSLKPLNHSVARAKPRAWIS